MNNSLVKKRKKKGFTLIELIVVLAIMAIIAAIAIPNFMKVKEHSKQKSDLESCQTIRRAVLPLVSDGTVKNGTYTIKAPCGGTVGEVTSSDSKDAASVTAIKSILTNTKAPQAAGTTDYQVVVKDEENVVVSTIGGDETVTTAGK